MAMGHMSLWVKMHREFWGLALANSNVTIMDMRKCLDTKAISTDYNKYMCGLESEERQIEGAEGGKITTEGQANISPAAVISSQIRCNRRWATTSAFG